MITFFWSTFMQGTTTFPDFRVVALCSRRIRILFPFYFEQWIFVGSLIYLQKDKVRIFLEGYKILRNLHLTFVYSTYKQKYGEDFAKFCGIYELYKRVQNIVRIFYIYWSLKCSKNISFCWLTTLNNTIQYNAIQFLL